MGGELRGVFGYTCVHAIPHAEAKAGSWPLSVPAGMSGGELGWCVELGGDLSGGVLSWVVS